MMPTRSAGAGTDGAARGLPGPAHVVEDLPRLDEEGGARRGQADVVGGAIQQPHAQLPLQPLDLLAQRGLDDVLTGGRPAEMQLFGQRHEIAQLP